MLTNLIEFQKIHVAGWLVFLCVCFNYFPASAAPVTGHFSSSAFDSPQLFEISRLPFEYTPGSGLKIFSPGNIAKDSLPKTLDGTVIIPFEYQQSALNYAYTFKLMDSVAEILLKNELVTLSIDGYSYFDEANDNICYWLSLNRALSVKSYVLGRGVDSLRIMETSGRSYFRSVQLKDDKVPVKFHCTAEIILNYPIPPPLVEIQDIDGDGIPDDADSCRSEYGDKSRNGCPDKNAIIVPFETQQSALFSMTYKVLDSVISMLRADPLLTISIQGHAHEKEGVESICERLAKERADIVRRYLLSRGTDPSRIDSVTSFGNTRPITAGRNSWEIARNSRAEIFLTHH